MAHRVVEDYNDVFLRYDPAANTTRNILTKYERTAVLALRIEQLSRNAAPCVDASSFTTMREIALRELEMRVLPFVVVRTLPNDAREYWKLRDMVLLRD